MDIIKEQKKMIKNQLIDYINWEIDTTKKQLKQSIESCNINYLNGSLDTLSQLKMYIKDI